MTTERDCMIGSPTVWEIGGDQKRGTLRHAGAAGDSFKLVYGDGAGDYAVLTVDQAREAVAAAIVAAQPDGSVQRGESASGDQPATGTTVPANSADSGWNPGAFPTARR